MAPMPMLMFSAVMYLVYISGSEKTLDTEKPEAHVFNEADHDKDGKSRSLPESKKH